jgi:hypothetical protein
VEQALRKELSYQRRRRRLVLVAGLGISGLIALAPEPVSAENLFDFFLGGLAKLRAGIAAAPQASFFADPSGNNPQPPSPAVASSGPAFCVRSCDGKYFPLMRGSATPVQMCQAFCPASATRVFYGANIDSAYSLGGERYADSANAFAYRKALRADCTCNGRDPAGLAPIDLALDSSLRPGDVIATTDGLVAYSGVRVGNDQTAEFTPIASYPGLTADVRARLRELKVTPASSEMVTGSTPLSVTSPPAIPAGPKAAPARDRRADAQ